MPIRVARGFSNRSGTDASAPILRGSETVVSTEPNREFHEAPLRALLSIPLFAVLLVVANGVMLGGPIDAPLVNVILGDFSLPSGRTVYLTVADALLLGGVVCLWLEVLKATRTGTESIVDHALSLVVFVIYLVEFLIVERLGNTTFLILMAMAFVDVVSGFSVTISSARRDFSVGG